MKSKCYTTTTWYLAPSRAIFGIAVVICCCTVISGCNRQNAPSTNASKSIVSSPAPAPALPGSGDADTALRDLRAIGTKIATAVLAKDSDTLLVYDRDDLRLQDEASLKDKKGGLYCYLFDSSCISSPKIPSVYEKLSTAQQLEIDASVMKSPDGRLYGTLVFYDKSQISEKRLHSSFVCTEEALKRIASWHFVLVGTKWNAATPFFDLDTDGLC
jgi:hypothetical protein